MRVLSLSHRIQNRFADNHTIFNAPNLVDYEAIVFDVAGVFESVRAAAEGRGEFITHASVPVVNGESVDATAGLAELLQRRREEMQRALERGARVVVYTAAPSRFSGVAGLQGFDRYFMLPAPDGMAWDANTIRGGEGQTAVVVDHDHPFVNVYETYRASLLYRAYFNDRAPGVAKHGHVFLRSTGGAPIGIEFPVLNGRLIFMPAPKEAGLQWLAGPEGHALVSAFRDAFGYGSEDDHPRWLRDYPVPGLTARESALREAEAELERARESVEAARTALDQATVIRDLLWIGHDLGVQRAAMRCAHLLGFDVAENDDGHVILTDAGTRIHMVAAAANEAVDMGPHYRLRARLDAILERSARAERGLIVANGQRMTRPEERKREFENSLRVAAEAVGYALLPGQALYRAVIAALEGASDDTLAEVRRRIATTNGIVELDDLLGGSSAEEAPTGEPAVEVEPAEADAATDPVLDEAAAANEA